MKSDIDLAYTTVCRNLYSASTQLPLHNICLIMLISQNDLFIIEKKKVNNYVVCGPFEMITSWANGDQL